MQNQGVPPLPRPGWPDLNGASASWGTAHPRPFRESLIDLFSSNLGRAMHPPQQRTAVELARLSGVSEKTIRKIRNGRVLASSETLLLLSLALNSNLWDGVHEAIAQAIAAHR